MKEETQLKVLNDKLNKLMLRKSALQQKNEVFKTKHGTRKSNLTATQLKTKEALKHKHKINNADIAKKKAEMKKIITMIKKKGGGTNEGINKLHTKYSPHFPPQQFKEIDTFYVKKVDKHVTLFTKLFILFIFYLQDLNDNKVDNVEITNKSLLWMLKNNLIGDDVENQKMHNLFLLMNTMNIMNFAYIDGNLSTCNYKNINECSWTTIGQDYIFPSEFVLNVDGEYKNTSFTNHLVYVWYAKNKTNTKGTLHIMDINCASFMNDKTFEKGFEQYFEKLKAKYVNVEKVIFCHSKLPIPRHSVILDDINRLSESFDIDDIKQGLCGYMSIFSHFLLSYENDKSNINKVLDMLTQVRFEEQDSKITSNVTKRSWFSLSKSRRPVTKKTDHIKGVDIENYKKLLKGRPNKDNFIQIVNMLKSNKLKTIKQLEQEDPILELYCSDNIFTTPKSYDVEEETINIADYFFESTLWREPINPCDGQFEKTLYAKIITYVSERFILPTTDPLFYMYYYLLVNSEFNVSIDNSKKCIKIIQKIFNNEYTVCIIKYLDNKEQVQQAQQAQQNAVNLNNHLTNYIASYLIGHIINKEKSRVNQNMKLIDTNLQMMQSYNSADDATKKVFKKIIITIPGLLKNKDKRHQLLIPLSNIINHNPKTNDAESIKFDVALIIHGITGVMQDKPKTLKLQTDTLNFFKEYYTTYP
jgi:hypothetical protein